MRSPADPTCTERHLAGPIRALDSPDGAIFPSREPWPHGQRPAHHRRLIRWDQTPGRGVHLRLVGIDDACVIAVADPSRRARIIANRYPRAARFASPATTPRLSPSGDRRAGAQSAEGGVVGRIDAAQHRGRTDALPPVSGEPTPSQMAFRGDAFQCGVARSATASDRSPTPRRRCKRWTHRVDHWPRWRRRTSPNRRSPFPARPQAGHRPANRCQFAS